MRFLLVFSFISILISSCAKQDKLPILGNSKIIDGKEVPHKVGAFDFVNQNGVQFTSEDLKGKIQVADFFFTTCPTICPTVMSQMVRIYDKYEKEESISLVSFSLDPKKDTIGALKAYAENLEVSTPRWNMLTGDKKEIHSLASDYFNIVVDDDEAPGGINHSGKIVLVDKLGRVRAFAEGTDPNEVDQLLIDIDKLLAEYQADE